MIPAVNLLDHILAITQAICDFRSAQGTDGPLFLGIDTHALSAPAGRTTLEVLAAAGVDVLLAPEDGPDGGFTLDAADRASWVATMPAAERALVARALLAALARRRWLTTGAIVGW